VEVVAKSHMIQHFNLRGFNCVYIVSDDLQFSAAIGLREISVTSVLNRQFRLLCVWWTINHPSL
jgi:hypothetical protein